MYIVVKKVAFFGDQSLGVSMKQSIHYIFELDNPEKKIKAEERPELRTNCFVTLVALMVSKLNSGTKSEKQNYIYLTR